MSNKISNFLELVDLAATPSNPSSGVRRVYAKSDNKMYSLDSSGLESNLCQPKKTVTLATPQSRSINTLIATPTMNFPVVAGKVYKIGGIISFQSIAGGNGVSVGVALISGAGTIIGTMRAPITQASATTEMSAGIRAIGAVGLTGSFITTTGVSPANSAHMLELNLVFTCTTSGTFTLTHASEATSTSTINTGSILMYEILN